jgi:CRISPR/Cas system endoribonuclease Cas6 (RAMP superfamily)
MNQTDFLTALRTVILRHFNAVTRSNIACSARQARIVFVVRGNKYSAAQGLFIMTSIFFFVRENASIKAQENSLWKYLYRSSPIERVVANLEDGLLGFQFIPIQKYID